jgi:hypothetical protein
VGGDGAEGETVREAGRVACAAYGCRSLSLVHGADHAREDALPGVHEPHR